MTVKATVTSTLNGQSVDFTLVEEDSRGNTAYETKPLSGGTETFIFTQLDGGRDKTYYPKIQPETTDITQTAQIPYGFEVDIDPLPHRNADAAGRVREDITFSQGVGARKLGLGGNGLTHGLLSAALNDGEALADNGVVYPSISTAENQASSWVFAGEGVFEESVVIDTPGLTLVGTGYSTVIDGLTTDAIEVTANDVTVANMSMRTNSTDGGFGFYANGADRVTALNLTVRNSGAAAYRAINGNYGFYDNCNIESGQAGSGYIFANSTNGGSLRNIIINSELTSGTDNALYLGDDDCIVADCVIFDAAVRGVLLEGNDCTFGGNRVRNSANDGVLVSGTDIIVYNNRVSDSGSGSDIVDSGTGTVLDANLTGLSN